MAYTRALFRNQLYFSATIKRHPTKSFGTRVYNTSNNISTKLQFQRIKLHLEIVNLKPMTYDYDNHASPRAQRRSNGPSASIFLSQKTFWKTQTKRAPLGVCNVYGKPTETESDLTRDAGPKPHIVWFSRLRREKPARALHRRAKSDACWIRRARRAR